MFSKSNKGSINPAESHAVQKSSAPSIISKDLKIVGDLSCEGEIQIDGAVDGDIRTKSLLVGETANIKGEIVADTLDVHGTINGQIKSRSVHLAKTAHVVGDILHENLAIETGAFLEGHCKRMADKKGAEDGRINVLDKDAPGKGPGAGAADAKERAPGSTPSKENDPKAVAATR